jgi:hypothetical protein
MKRKFFAISFALTILITNTLGTQASSINKQVEGKNVEIKGHWAESAFNKLIKHAGFKDKLSNIKPNKVISRKDFILLLHKSLDIQLRYFKAPDIKEYFKDVKNEAAYSSELYDLTLLGIVDFKKNFKPNMAITREEMIHLIMNAYKYKMGDNYKEIKMLFKEFADGKRINPIYQGDIGRANYLGFILRPNNNMFYPKHKATWGQGITVIEKLITRLEKENSTLMITTDFEKTSDGAKMRITVQNDGKAPVILSHSSSQKFDFKLLDGNKNNIYTWSADKLFLMALTETFIEAGKSAVFEEELPKDIYDSIKDRAEYMKAYVLAKTSSYKFNENGYEIMISTKE